MILTKETGSMHLHLYFFPAKTVLQREYPANVRDDAFKQMISFTGKIY
jgi:hypothetical protein